MKQIPEVDDNVTISSNKVHGDRSYNSSVWKVEAVNATHIKAKSITKDGFWTDRSSQILQIDEYDFSLADDFIE